LCRDFDGDVKEIFLVNMLLWEKEKVLRWKSRRKYYFFDKIKISVKKLGSEENLFVYNSANGIFSFFNWIVRF
jgi:hypothetical protein